MNEHLDCTISLPSDERPKEVRYTRKSREELDALHKASADIMRRFLASLQPHIDRLKIGREQMTAMPNMGFITLHNITAEQRDAIRDVVHELQGTISDDYECELIAPVIASPPEADVEE